VSDACRTPFAFAGVVTAIARPLPLTRRAVLITLAALVSAVLAAASGIAGARPALAAPASPASPASPAAPFSVGTRFTWQSGDSTLEGLTMVPDPDGIFERDGQTYSPQSTGGSGGVGLEQVTIVAADQSGLVGDVRTFLNVDLQNNLHVAGTSGVVVGDATRLDPYWMSPSVLAGLAVGFDGVTTVTRGTRVFNGQQLDVVSIATQTSAGYSSSTYELTTGLLVFGGTMTPSPGTTLTQNGQVLLDARGSVAYSHRQFVGARVVQVPWTAEPAPAWAAVGTSATYAGGTTMQPDPSSGLSPLAGQQVSITYAFDRPAGAAAVLGRQVVQASTTNGVPPTEQVSDRVFASATFDGLWIPPSALAALQPGQVLDSDPFTGQTVTFAGPQQGGALIVVASSTEQLELSYDTSTGRLQTAVNRQSSGQGLGTQVLELRWTGQ